jgi:hypothetical protein
MAPQQVQWGTITLYLDDETFRTSFTNGRSMYFDDSVSLSRKERHAADHHRKTETHHHS